jgi:ribosomal protein S18 acetylase RimI-like enzyme
MVIRHADPSDIPSLLPMIAKTCALHQSWDAAKYGSVPHPERLYLDWLASLLKNQRHLCLVACSKESDAIASQQLIALLIATVEREIPLYSLKEFGFIQDLWVEPEYRHIGIARQMLEHAITHFTQLGIKQIRLDTASANDVARSLFTSIGFRPSRIEMLLELD